MTAMDPGRWEGLTDREAAEEPLTPAERALLAELRGQGGELSADDQLFARLALLDAEPGPADAALAERAVAAALAARRAPVARRAWLAPASALAVAAAAALWLGTRSGPPAAATAEVELVTGTLLADGQAVGPGARLREGAVLVASGGPACVSLPAAVHACLADGARATLASLEAPARSVRLEAGRVAAALAPQRAGERFSIVARGVYSTAVGTAFSVAIDARGRSVTTVHEGKVQVGGRDDGPIVPSHKLGLSSGGAVEVADLEEHATTETPEWQALARVAGRSVEDETSLPAPRAAIPSPEPRVEEPAAAQPVVAAAPAAPRAAAAPVEAPPASAAELLAAARGALRARDFAGAAESYRKLVAAHPASPEASPAQVSLAALEIDQLAAPELGLARAETYLAHGGPLELEARRAKVRALRALGRGASEARAIDELLAAHPATLEADALRARRAALAAP